VAPAVPDLPFDVGAAVLRRPPFALEHFEHGKLVGRKRVALDRLQMGSLGESPVLSGGSGRAGIPAFFGHGSILPQFVPVRCRRLGRNAQRQVGRWRRNFPVHHRYFLFGGGGGGGGLTAVSGFGDTPSWTDRVAGCSFGGEGAGRSTMTYSVRWLSRFEVKISVISTSDTSTRICGGDPLGRTDQPSGYGRFVARLGRYTLTSPSLRARRRGCFGRTSKGHRRTRATGTRQFSPGSVERMASAMVAEAARSPARLLLSTAMMAMGACGCSSAMLLSAVTMAVKPPRSAAARSSSSRNERQLWKTADSTATPPSCRWSGWRRRGDTPTSRRTFTPGRQDGAAQSGLRAAAAQTADAPARRTAVAALRSI